MPERGLPSVTEVSCWQARWGCFTAATAKPSSMRSCKLAKTVELWSGLPVRMWDERSTTVTATQYLNMTDVRGKKRKNTIDAVAATIILESYLAYRKNHPGEE